MYVCGGKNETDNGCCQCYRRVDRWVDAPGKGEEGVGGGIAEVGLRAGAGVGGGASERGEGRSGRKLVTAFLAPVGDVDVRGHCSCRDVHEFADTGRYFPVLGFAGDRVGRVCCREERGKNR